MKKLLPLLLLLTACGGSDTPEPKDSNARNANSNAMLVREGQVRAVTENPSTTDLQKAAERIEVPHLKGGAENLFVVHTVAGYGVNYCVEYNCNLRASWWSAYRWYKGFSHNVKKDEGKDAFNRKYWDTSEWMGDPFQVDPLIPVTYQSTPRDHSSNGHDRGHMLGSADRLNSRDANEQTFYLSNIHPQLAGFNQQGIWNNLEIRLRDMYDLDTFRDTLYVVKGGTIGPKMYDLVRGSSGNQLPSPHYFFMALLCKKNSDSSQGGYKAIGFWMKHESNTSAKYKDYAVSIDQLESLTGLDFFCNLPDDIEQQVEASLGTNAWKLN